MDYNTIIGKSYAVTAVSVPVAVLAVLDDGSTVNLLTIESGGQAAFGAPTSKTTLSAGDALLTEASFNLALPGSSSGGGGDSSKPYLSFVEGSIVTLEADRHYKGTLSGATEWIVPPAVADNKPHEIVLDLTVTDDAAPIIDATPLGDPIALTAGAWFILFKWHSMSGDWTFTGERASS